MSSELSAIQVTDWPVFGISKTDKTQTLYKELQRLTLLHQECCPEYKKLLKVFADYQPELDNTDFALQNLFPLPVRLFKSQQLKSVPDNEIIKTMTSSGTSGQEVSKIYLDKDTSALQVKVLSKIVTEIIGPKRLPMLIIDCPSTIKNRTQFSARTTGILGFSMYGRDLTFALNDDMSLNLDEIKQFEEKYQDQPCFLFGFTFVVWLHFVEALEKSGHKITLPKGILLHGGGWKKLGDNAVSKEAFKSRFSGVTDITRVHNYYGMVEQTGSIFIECEHGHFHCSSWSDILVRDPVTRKVMKKGESGIIQLFSALPRSYPGHSILSEDIGKILGEDDCPCGRKGVYFQVEGRMKQAEIRGCSDTYSK